MTVDFVIDGFNLYHSIVDVINNDPKLRAKWLDIRSLCTSLLRQFDRKAELGSIFYFSAIAHHKNTEEDPFVVQRQDKYIKCLMDSGVVVSLGKFRKVTMTCPKCEGKYNRREEKKTDVALALKAFERLTNPGVDRVVIASGDSDFTPIIDSAERLGYLDKICFAFPFGRRNRDLANDPRLAKGFRISKTDYFRNQFDDPQVLSSGKLISKPVNW